MVWMLLDVLGCFRLSVDIGMFLNAKFKNILRNENALGFFKYY